MAFFDGINKSLNSVKQSTQRTAELSRVQRRINAMGQEIEKVFHQIGQSYYSGLKKGGADFEALGRLCSTIDTLERDVEALRKQTDELKRLRRCPECGHAQNIDSKFCASCGHRLKEDEAEGFDSAEVGEPAESAEDRPEAEADDEDAEKTDDAE